MIRDQYSYWLTVSNDTRTADPDILQRAASELAPLLQDFDIVRSKSNAHGPNTIEFSVNENLGTIEDVSDSIFDIVSKTAAKYPSLCFVLDENNEENHSEMRRTLWHDGQSISSCAALIDPLDEDELRARLGLDNDRLRRRDASFYLKKAAEFIEQAVNGPNGSDDTMSAAVKCVRELAEAILSPDKETTNFDWEAPRHGHRDAPR